MATTRRKTIRPVTRQLVLKASSESDPVAVFSSSGKLLGIVDPSKITPVVDPGGEEQPKPTTSQETTAASGQDPEMGIAKARAAALTVKKRLYGGGSVEDREKVATAMNEAAIAVERQIHQAGPRRWR